MSHIPYHRLLDIASEYSTHAADSDANKRFAQRVLERMFYRGKHGSLISLSLCSTAGMITLPEEVQHIEKAKVNGKVASVFSHWYDFSNASQQDFQNNFSVIKHLPNRFYTQYEPLTKPFTLVIKPRNRREDASAGITVHGKDKSGEDIVTRYGGTTIEGEALPLIKGKSTAGTIEFFEITGVEKTKTKDYIDLYAKDVETKQLTKLSSYAPKETRPSYTRVQVDGCSSDSIYHIDILARLRILDEYSCNELIPIIGLDVLELICQEIRALKDSNFNDTVAAGKIAEQQIRNENNYKYGNNQDIMDIRDMSGEDPGSVW